MSETVVLSTLRPSNSHTKSMRPLGATFALDGATVPLKAGASTGVSAGASAGVGVDASGSRANGPANVNVSAAVQSISLTGHAGAGEHLNGSYIHDGEMMMNGAPVFVKRTSTIPGTILSGGGGGGSGGGGGIARAGSDGQALDHSQQPHYLYRATDSLGGKWHVTDSETHMQEGRCYMASTSGRTNLPVGLSYMYYDASVEKWLLDEAVVCKVSEEVAEGGGDGEGEDEGEGEGEAKGEDEVKGEDEGEDDIDTYFDTHFDAEAELLAEDQAEAITGHSLTLSPKLQLQGASSLSPYSSSSSASASASSSRSPPPPPPTPSSPKRPPAVQPHDEDYSPPRPMPMMASTLLMEESPTAASLAPSAPSAPRMEETPAAALLEDTLTETPAATSSLAPSAPSAPRPGTQPLKSQSMTPEYALSTERKQAKQAKRAHICPLGHGLETFTTEVHHYSCSKCETLFMAGTKLHGCRRCDFDICDECYEKQ